MLREKSATFPVMRDAADLRPAGGFTRIDDQSFYSIHDYDRLDPFLMSIVSHSDHWMYLSSLGGLTAGRANPDRALFPYDSEDKLHQCHPHTGPRTARTTPRAHPRLARHPRGTAAITTPVHDHVDGHPVRPGGSPRRHARAGGHRRPRWDVDPRLRGGDGTKRDRPGSGAGSNAGHRMRAREVKEDLDAP